MFGFDLVILHLLFSSVVYFTMYPLLLMVPLIKVKMRASLIDGTENYRIVLQGLFKNLFPLGQQGIMRLFASALTSSLLLSEFLPQAHMGFFLLSLEVSAVESRLSLILTLVLGFFFPF